VWAVAVVAAAWLTFVVFLAVARPERESVRATMRLVPDTVRLLRRLVRDKEVPRSARVPVWLLLVYLASPLDIVPDFMPFVGFADDAVLIAIVLRRLVRTAGAAKMREHWPGDAVGLARLERLLRVES
jgi:uncharacterized membrane protein YkvA (DUF1232 family)